MARPELLTRPPDPRRDRTELFDLVAKVFSRRGYFEFRDYARDVYLGHSHYDWDTSRVAFLDGRMVCHVGVWDYRMRIGREDVRCAGVGAVATHHDYRKRGLMARLLPTVLDAMRTNGYDVSLLFGIHNFYDRFRYVRAWPSTCHTVATDHLPADEAPRLARFAPRARADLDALYNRHHAGLTGTAHRPTYRRNRRGKTLVGYLWRGPGGAPAGYLLAKHEHPKLVCPELAGPADEALAAVRDLARRHACTEVVFPSLPHLHPAATILRRGTCRVENGYVANGGPMIRIVNLAGVLEKIAPELARRLKAGPRARWRGRVLLTDGEDRAVLTVGQRGLAAGPAKAGKEKHAIRAGAGLARLLIGSDRPEEVVAEQGIRLTGQARELLGELFPCQYPSLNQWDAF